MAGDGLPSKPSGFKATAGDKRVDLTWSDPDDDSITHYETRHKAGTAFDAKDDLWTPVPDSDAKTTSHAVTGLTNGTTYVFQVRAVNADGAGEPSEPRTAAPVVGYSVEQPPTPNNPKDTIVTTGDQEATDRAGSIEGLFRVTETGAASYRIPLPTAAGTAGVVPELALAYDSQAGNGIAGLGFRLEGVSGIARCRQTTLRDGAAKALSWSADDRFCLDGQRLVLASRATDPDQVAGTPAYGAPNTIYRTEVDSGVWVTAKGGTAGNPDYFEARAKDGSVRHYGRTPSNSDTKARLEHAGSTLVWSLRRFTDSVGNPVWYEYANDADGQRLTEVRWAYGSKPGPGKGHNAELTFTYEDRDDPIRGYVAGATLTTAKLLSKVTLRNNVDGAFKEVKTLSLEYEVLGDSVLDRTSRLKTIKDCVGTKAGDERCLPETTFTWPARTSGWESKPFSKADLTSGRKDLGLLTFLPADINGDGRLDMVWLQWDLDPSSEPDHHLRYGIFKGTGFVPANFHFDESSCDEECLKRIEFMEHPGNDSPERKSQRVKIAVLDYNADGRHDLAVWRTFLPGTDDDDPNPQWRVHLSTPQQDGSWRLSKDRVDTGITGRKTSFMDVDGDGLADAVTVTGRKRPQNESECTDKNSSLDEGKSDIVTTTVRHLRRKSLSKDKDEEVTSSNQAYAFESAATLLHVECRPKATPTPLPYIRTEGAPRGGFDFNGDGRSDHLINYVSWIEPAHQANAAQEQELIATPANYHRAMVMDGDTAKAFGDSFGALNREVRLHPLDANGDGLTDLVVESWSVRASPAESEFELNLSTGSGFVSTALDFKLTVEDVEILGFPDHNGDGHPDFVWHDREAKRIYAYLWDPKQSTFVKTTEPLELAITEGAKQRLDTYVDIDGDGAAEWLHFDLDKDRGPNQDKDHQKLYVYHNGRTGSRPNAVTEIKNGLGATTTLRYGTLAQSSHYVRQQLGGTVTKKQCFNGLLGLRGCHEYQAPNVTDTDIENFYERLNGDWQLPDGAQTLGKLGPVLEVRGAIAVVERVTATAPTMTTQGTWNTGATSWVDHYYAGARLQGGGLGLLGFEQLSTHDGQTGIRATTSYRQDFPFIGRPLRTTVRTPPTSGTRGHLLSDASTEWRVRGLTSSWKATAAADGTAALGPMVVHAAKATEESYTLAVSGTGGNRKEGEAAGKRYREERTATTVDEWGNAVKVTVEALNAAGTETFKTETTSNFGPTDPSRRLGRLTGTEVTKSRGSSKSTRKTQFAYYGDSGCDLTNAKAKGMLCAETLAPGIAALQRKTTHRYDGFGNRVRSAVTARGDDGKAETRCDVDTAAYDATGRWVRIERDCLGRKVREVTKREDHWGLPTSTRVYLDSAGSAHRTETRAYTRRGVAYFTAAGDGSYATETWGLGTGNHCPEGTKLHVQRTAAGGGESASCLDAVGREVRSAELGFEGDWSHRDTGYDASGRVSFASLPYWKAETACEREGSGNRAHRPRTHCWAKTSHDLLGRPYLIERPDGSKERIAHGVDSDGRPYTERTNARGHARRETRNALGELVVAEDALGGTVTHRHDAWGLLERVVQRKPADDATAAPASIETTMDHDGLGRRTLLKDPDKGTWTFRHNGFGELVRRESAAGHQVTFRHDALGRVTMRDDQLGGTGKRDGQTVWTYDTAANGLGRLHRVKEQMSGFSRTHEYDALGRERDVASRLGGETRHERTTYDAHGRVFQRFDASRTAADFSDFGVRHVYNARGHLARVEDARVRNGTSKATHLAVELTDAAGRVVQERLGGDGGLTRVLGHDGQTGRLLGIVTDKLGGGRLQELEMAWDVGGNLKSRMDKGRKGTLTEDFEYDGLDRLEEHEAGAGPVETITYDGYGNIRSRTGVGTYTYSKAHPGRLDKVAGSTYAHDANGNVTSGGGRSIEYASYDLPTAIQRGLARSEFTYGPDRERLVRRDLSGGELLRETWHLSGVERTRAADGSVELKRFLPGGAMETVAYDADGAETSRRLDYLLSDHLGSVVAVVEGTETPSGQTRWDVREERAFDPWGACRDPDTWKACAKDSVLPKDDGATRRGFTGHETLGAVGLVHMNGRIYDPALGRFLQADPYVQSGSDLQGLNRYAYVLNNPLNAVDPSGHFVFTLTAVALTAKAKIGWVILAATLGGFADAMVAGADFGQALRAGLISGITAGGVQRPVGGAAGYAELREAAAARRGVRGRGRDDQRGGRRPVRPRVPERGPGRGARRPAGRRAGRARHGRRCGQDRCGRADRRNVLGGHGRKVCKRGCLGGDVRSSQSCRRQHTYKIAACVKGTI